MAALLAQDPRVRRAEEDAVHQMRVAARQAAQRAQGVQDRRRAGPSELQDELQWLGAVLGEARDLEVIRARFARELAALDPELVVGPDPGPAQRRPAGRASRRRYERIREALGGERYYALLDALDDLVATPMLTKAAASRPRTRSGTSRRQLGAG